MLFAPFNGPRCSSLCHYAVLQEHDEKVAQLTASLDKLAGLANESSVSRARLQELDKQAELKRAQLQVKGIAHLGVQWHCVRMFRLSPVRGLTWELFCVLWQPLLYLSSPPFLLGLDPHPVTSLSHPLFVTHKLYTLAPPSLPCRSCTLAAPQRM